jgi:hypothetical protein
VTLESFGETPPRHRGYPHQIAHLDRFLLLALQELHTPSHRLVFDGRPAGRTGHK